MSDSTKRSQEYKDFRLRRRYDHFLRFKVARGKPEEIIKVAKDLGFNLDIKELTKKRAENVELTQKATFFGRLRGFFKSYP